MQRLALALLAASLTLSACSRVHGRSVAGSGTRASETRTVAEFDAIEARGAFRLEVRSGAATQGVTIEGDDNLVPLLVTSVSGGTLALHLPEGSWSPKTPLVVRVDARALAELDVAGAIDTTVTGIAGDRFDAELSGACELDARGSIGTAQFRCAGACEVDAFELIAPRVELDVSGACRAHVHASASLLVAASGACEVRYRGHPASVESSAKGASTIRPD